MKSEPVDSANEAGIAEVSQAQDGASKKPESADLDSPTVESVKSEFERIASEIVSSNMADGDDLRASEISANGVAGHEDGAVPIAEKPIEAESAREPASVGQSGASVEQAGAVVDQPNAAVEQLNASADQHGPAVEDSNADSAANSLAEDGQPGSSGADSSDSAFGLKENEKGADFFESADSPLGSGESDNKKPDFPTLFAFPESSEKARKTSKTDTCIIVNSLIGIGNKPYLRGAGGGLSPDKGVPMEYLEIGKWRYVFPPDSQFPIEFSVYKNDETRSDGGEVFQILPNEKLELNLRFTI